MSYSTSCLKRCNHSDKLTCQCDTECEIFGDCCADFQTQCQVNTTINVVAAKHNLSACTKVYHNENVQVGYMISRCPSSWTEPIVRARCSSYSLDMHVYDIDGHNYHNIYCALCHNRRIRDILFWDIDDNSVSGCPTDISGTAAKMIKKETFQLRGKLFRRCFTGGDCPPTYSNTSVISSCSSYVFPVHVCQMNNIRDLTFKNPHCALCNGYNVLQPQLDCGIPFFGGQEIWQFSTFDKPVAPFTLICPVGEGPDEIAKSCRPIICPRGYSINGLKCILDNTTEREDIVGTWDCGEEITYFLFRGNYSTRFCILQKFERHHEVYYSRMFKQQASEFDDDLWVALKFTNENARKAVLHFIKNESQSKVLRDLNSCRLNEIEIISTCSKNEYECSGQWISGTPTYFRRVFGVLNDTEVYQKDTVYFKADKIIYVFNHDFRLRKLNSYEVMLFCAVVIDVPSLDCAMIKLSRKEYSFRKLGFYYGEVKFETDEYVILPNGHAHVCLSVIEHFSKQRMKVSESYRFVSGALDAVHFSLSCLSIMGLFFTLVTYMRFKQLYNLYGVCILGLSLDLLLANGFTILSDKIQLSGSVCIAFAAITHYFWLAAFTWMTSISAVMLDTFVVNRTKPIRKSIKAYTVILLTGWGTPLFIILVLLFLQFCELCSPSGIAIYDGVPTCWLATPSINLYAFGIPVMISLAINMVLMSILMVSLRKARETSNKLQHRKKNDGSWKEALLCLKVSCCDSL